MKFQSLLRLFGDRRPGKSLRRRDRVSRQRAPLFVEHLETRELLSVVPPQIVNVTPVDGSPLAGGKPVSNSPQLTITFSQNVLASDATNPNNYLLFGSHDNQLTVSQATYSPANDTVTLTYSDPATTGVVPTGTLVTDTYTLFVRANNIHSALDGVTPVAAPGTLAVANSGADTVSLVNLEGPGSPAPGSLDAINNHPIPFAPATNVTQFGTQEVTDVQVANVLGDGPDLVALTDTETLTTNSTIQFQDQIIIVPAKPGGGFISDPTHYQRLTIQAAGTRAGDMIIKDLTGNGLQDIVVADARFINGVATGSNDVSVFLASRTSTGGTSFAEQDLPAGNTPIAVVATSLTLGPIQDLIVANGNVDGSGNGDINVLVQNATNPGTFAGAVAIQTAVKTFATSMVLADPNASLASVKGKVTIPANNDPGDLREADLVVSTPAGIVIMKNVTQVNTLLGTVGDFQAQTPLALPNAKAVTVGNFTGHTDNLLDIAASDGHNIFVLPNQGGTFGSPVQVFSGGGEITQLYARAVQSSSPGATAADLFAVDNGNSQVITLLNHSTAGQVSFGAPAFYTVDSGPQKITVLDANADGIPDIVSANLFGSDVSVVFGNGNGTFRDTADTGVNGGPVAIAVGPLTNDGLPDIVFATGSANSIGVMLANPGGGYQQPVYYTNTNPAQQPPLFDDPVAIGLGDIAGHHLSNLQNHFDDIVVVNQQDGMLTLLINQGDGTFVPENDPSTGQPVQLQTGPTPTGIALGDFAQNGAMDIAVSHKGNGSIGRGVSVFLGQVNPSTGIPTGLYSGAVEYANTLNAVAVTAGFFGNNGLLDLAVLDQEQSGNVAILSGLGNGTFIQTGLYMAGAFPSSFAVGDLNRDGFPDIVVTDNSAPPNPNTGRPRGTGSVAILLNAAGNGFDAPIYINSTAFADLPFESVTITDVNQDLYPDLIVTTANDNIFTLVGNGDGAFQQPVGYAVSGGHADSAGFVALVSDPLVRVTTFTTSGTVVAPELLENGNFEALSLSNAGTSPEKGNMAGWNTFDEAGSSGQWGPQTGTLTPLSSNFIEDPTNAPPPGTTTTSQATSSGTSYALVLDQPKAFNPNPGNGPAALSPAGTHVLYQDFTISPTAMEVTISFDLYINDDFGSNLIEGVNQYSNSMLNPSLDYALSQNTGSPNQQVRVDVIDPTVNLLAVPAPGLTSGNGVFLTLFQTTPQTLFGTNQAGAPPLGYMKVEETLNENQLTALGLQNPTTDHTLRLRVAAANTLGQMIVGVTNVQINEIYNDSVEAPVVTGLQLRNPGVGGSGISANGSSAGNTTDTTLVGQVFDAGGPNNVAYVLIDTNFGQPGHVNFQQGVGSGVYRVSTFDPTGHFETTLPLTLPSQVINGVEIPTQIGVEAVSKSTLVANNGATATPLTSMQATSFVDQGPNPGSGSAPGQWQAMGSGPISTTGLGLNYNTVSGRVTSVVVDPRQTSGNVMYVGTDNGGVWKTVDGGVDWTPLTDNLTDSNGNPVTASISSLALDPVNPAIIYAATGVADPTVTQGGSGIFISLNGGLTWSPLASSVFAGARISQIAVSAPEEDGLERIYVGVASGGMFGPGLYRSTNQNPTMASNWTNVLNPNNMFLNTPTGAVTLASKGVTAVASVTSIAIDTLIHEQHDLFIGIGNLGGILAQTAGNAPLSAGVWSSPDNGQTWFQLTGGVTPGLAHDTLPSGAGIGRVTVALPQTNVRDDGIMYVLISTTSGATEGSAIADASGNAAIAGLYKSKNGGNDWTHVMLRQSLPTATNAHNFLNLELTATIDGSSYGAMAVDPNDADVVYLGGARIDGGQQHSLIRVDTSDMRDTSYFDPITLTIPNDGDDIQKGFEAELLKKAYPVGSGPGAYVGEGVFWTDLEQNTSGAITEAANGQQIQTTLLPPFIDSLTFDPQGRLLIGTNGGIWRGISYGFGYNLSPSPGSILAGNSTTANTQGMLLTSLNGNLQVSDTTSVAIDPSNPNVLYSSNTFTGWALSNGSLTWSSIGPAPISTNIPQLPLNILQQNPGVVRVGPVNPTIFQEVTSGAFGATVNPAAGIPTTVYLANTQAAMALGNVLQAQNLASDVLVSTNGGQSFSVATVGIRPTDALAANPPLAVDPETITVTSPTAPNDPSQDTFENLLIYGAARAYRSENGSISWIQDSAALPSVITAAAVSPTTDPINQVFYVGTSTGQVFVDFNNNGKGYINSSSGLPSGVSINNITIDPNNAMIAYVMEGGSGGHVFRTTNAGASWTNITSNLPNVAANALAIDDRAFPNAPQGTLYLGTQVGVYTSTNLGSSWTRLGAGLPNVPVVDLALSTTNSLTNEHFEKLVVATLGRGIFQISTNRIGPNVTGASPGLPASPGLTSATVTFDEAVDPRTFTPNAVQSFVGPNGPIQVLSVTDLDPATHQVFQLNFLPQNPDGVYHLTLGTTITDLAGNPLNQNGNFINGENPQDQFNFSFAINSTDDGRFITGTYHNLLSRPADVGGFLSLLSAVDIARFQTLNSVALTLVSSNEARGDLIDNPNTGTGYYPELLHRSAAPAEIASWVAALNQGETPAQIVAAIVGSNEYYNQASVGGNDNGFIQQLYLNLLDRPVDSGGLATFLGVLSNAEQASRLASANALDQSSEYRADLITQAYLKYLGRSPSTGDIATWEAQFQGGITDEMFLAALAGSAEFFAKQGSSNTNWVNAVYQDILNRAPDPGGAAAVLGQLQAGTPRGTVALELLTSTEYRQGLVQSDYERLLGRNADAGGLAFFVGRLQQGASDEAVISTLVSSAEYFNNHAGVATTQQALDQNWIAAAYQSLLARPADAGGTAFFAGNLAAAESTARAAVAQAIVGSTEYKSDYITSIYQSYLGRKPAAAEINQWLTVLNQPSPGPGKPNVDEIFQAAVLSSQENFALAPIDPTTGVHTNGQWLQSAYLTALGRPADSTGFNIFLNAILSGYQPQRLNVENAVVASTEYLTDVVTSIYETYLRRAPIAGDQVSAKVAQLQNGTLTDESLIGSLLVSSEYFTNPNLGANNNSTWLNQVYVDLLGVDVANPTVASQAQMFLTELNTGLITLQGVVNSLLTGDLYRNRLITTFYEKYLRRAPLPSELTFWTSQLANHVSDEKVIAQILASNEYFTLPHTYP